MLLVIISGWRGFGGWIWFPLKFSMFFQVILNNHVSLIIRRRTFKNVPLRSVQFSHSVMSDSLWPHGLQHTRLPCPSSTPRACSDSCPSRRWCHPSTHLILCCPLLLLPSIFPSITVFSTESVLRIRCPKYWIFSFNISPSNEHPGLIYSRMDWLDLHAVQGTLKSLLQHHNLKASILCHLAFFKVQLSHPYITIGKKK